MAAKKVTTIKPIQGRAEARGIIAEIERVDRRIDAAEKRKKALQSRLEKLDK